MLEEIGESKKFFFVCEISQGSWQESFIFQFKEKWKNKLNKITIYVDDKNSHSLPELFKFQLLTK